MDGSKRYTNSNERGIICLSFAYTFMLTIKMWLIHDAHIIIHKVLYDIFECSPKDLYENSTYS